MTPRCHHAGAGAGAAESRSSLSRSAAIAARSGHAVLREPLAQALVAVLGVLLLVARAVVGEEGVPCVRVQLKRGFLGGGAARAERLLHLLDAIQRDALILPAVQAQHR